jgi:hypothetical protein
MDNHTTSKDTPGRRPAASEKATLVYRLPLDRKRKIHARLAASGKTIQDFLHHGVQLALAQLEKN